MDQSSTVFTGIFVIVWVGSAVVTLNSKLLGGKIAGTKGDMHPSIKSKRGNVKKKADVPEYLLPSAHYSVWLHEQHR
ncbi:MAG: hypothetical protein BJ554DRAFT_2000, partial [Olpidium bornovanus]